MKMMPLHKIQVGYDEIAKMPAGENQAHMFNVLETYWDEYRYEFLGEYRSVIDDRRDLAISKILQAGFGYLI